MGILKNRAPTEEQQPHQQQHSSHEDVANIVKPETFEEEKVTLLACILGAVASCGGFIFGYVRYALLHACHRECQLLTTFFC